MPRRPLAALLLLATCSGHRYTPPSTPCGEWREDVEAIYRASWPTYGPVPVIACPGEEIRID